MTKTWSGLILGIAARETGLVDVDETFGDLWPDAFPPGTEARANLTVEQLLQMRTGLGVPSYFLEDILNDADPMVTKHRAGGPTFNESLFYHPLNTSETGNYLYLPVGNLVSYITREKTGKTPEEYAKEKLFPFLGISEEDDWYVNLDGVNLGYHGLQMNARAISKISMLYLQNGLASETDRVLDESWINASQTVGDTNAEQPFGYLMWLGNEPAYCIYGFGGQRSCYNYETNRVISVFSETYEDEVMGGDNDPNDPAAESATDSLVRTFMFEEPSEPVVCASVAANTTDGDTPPPSMPSTTPPPATSTPTAAGDNTGGGDETSVAFSLSMSSVLCVVVTVVGAVFSS